MYNTDNSNHHNTHAPEANHYNINATNVGNSHTNVSQRASSVYQSEYPSSYGQRQDFRPPSESLPIRDKQYKRVKQVTFNDWTDKRKVTYKEVPDDRPC